MQPDFLRKKYMMIFRVLLIIFSGYFGMICSFAMKPGYTIMELSQELKEVYLPIYEENLYGISNPLWFKPYVNEYTPKGILMGIIISGCIIMYMWAVQGDYIGKKAFGTSKYENPHKANKKISHPPHKTTKDMIYKETIYIRPWYRFFLKTKKEIKIHTMNRRLSENVYYSMDTHHTDRNNNLLLVAGSGAGKTFKVARNILRQMNGTYVVTDPKGELAKKEGGYLEKRGYDVKVLNILDIHSMKKSVRYNPFVYIKDDVDVIRLATNIMANTKAKDVGTGGDPFFDTAAQSLLEALMHYVCDFYKNVPKKRNFRTLMELLSMASFEIDPETMSKKESDLDKLFRDFEHSEKRRIEREKKEGKIPRPMSLSIEKYNSIMRTAADTARGIVSTLDSRLSKLHVHEVLELLSEDEINIAELGMGRNFDGKTKTALFLVIPDSDPSFNFIIGMFYTQLNQILAHQADVLCEGGALPISVTMLMDEFANVALPEDYDKKLSTMRSRNMNAVIILQNLAQIKKLFEKDWESICGNCDTFLYLGGNEQSSHEYVSKMMDKATCDKRTTGEQLGMNGHSNRNYDVIGRELLTPGEVRKLDRDKCIILIAGIDPIMDYKIKTWKHPLFKYIKENYKYDRRKVPKNGMRLVNSAYAEALKREEEYEESKKTLTINGDALMSLSSEAIDAYAGSSWYSSLTKDLMEIDILNSIEMKKDLPLTDDELINMPQKDMEVLLILRSDGYSDRQGMLIISLVNAGRDLEETKKMFPSSMSAERMEKLAKRFIA